MGSELSAYDAVEETRSRLGSPHRATLRYSPFPGQDATMAKQPDEATETTVAHAGDSSRGVSTGPLPESGDTTLHLRAGPPETVLPDAPDEARGALAQALAAPAEGAREAIATIAAAYPSYLEAWARLATVARDPVEAYAYARVGYHRGLDALRAAGWRGSGYVRWANPSNRGFLMSLEALAWAAADLGEEAEADRCRVFLRQLDPEWQRRKGG